MAFIPIENLGGGESLPSGVLYDSGKGKNNFDNSGHALNSGFVNDGNWTFGNASITQPAQVLSEIHHSAEFITKNAIDFSSYTVLHINCMYGTTSKSLTLNVSSVTSSAYIHFYKYCYNNTAFFGFIVSSNGGDNFYSNPLAKYEDSNANNTTVTIQKIWLT